MDYKLRRIKQKLNKKDCLKILNDNQYGVLALINIDNTPYSIPLNYFYFENKIYFHGAKNGQKIDAMNYKKDASFCIVDQSDFDGKNFTCLYRSLIIDGEIEFICEEKEKYEILMKIATKCNSDTNVSKTYVEKHLNSCSLFCLIPKKISGKVASELIK